MRLFIATTFPAEILRDLNDRIAPLKGKLPPASWVKPETQHLTFAFLGEQDESILDRINIDPGPAFEATLHGCGFFPNRGRPRVGWVGVEPADAFIALAHRVREAVKGFDDKPFKPHLTLMRVRDSWPATAVDSFEHALRDYRSVAFPIDRVVLYKSQLSPKGAVHTSLREFTLKA